MLAWKNERKGSTALLVKEARRVGKSTLVEQFAETIFGHTMPKGWGGNAQAVGTRCPSGGEAMPKAWGALINKLKEDKKEMPTLGTVSNQGWA
mgnify:CR=1 FL=1